MSKVKTIKKHLYTKSTMVYLLTYEVNRNETMSRFNFDLLNDSISFKNFELFDLKEENDEISFNLAYFGEYNEQEINSLIEEFADDYLDAFSTYGYDESEQYDNVVNVLIEGVYIDRLHRNYL